MPPEQKPGIFFDKDGVLEIPEYKDGRDWAMKNPEQMQLYDNVDTVTKLQQQGFRIFVITNQPDIALGNITEETKEELKRRFKSLLHKRRVRFDEIMYCHHHEKSINPNYPADCNCRKPKPGMIFALAKKW
jgi:D-glycero-D-manno-heptose 1,7-bisphosphate phosphatase